MVIGIDIDDVITDSSELITEYIKKYCGLDSIDFVNNVLHASNVDKQLKDFYNSYLAEMVEKYNPKRDAKEVIDRLRLKGHKIIVITFRGYGEYAGLIDITNDYFKRYQINVDKIVFKQKNKREACIENKLDIMVDDSIEVLKSIEDTNIKPILFSSMSNKDNQSDFDRVSSWLELEKYIDSLN